MARTSDRPIPEPATARTREPRESSSHTASCSASGMPLPVSATSTTTQRWPSMICSLARSSTTSAGEEYLSALPSRLRIAVSSRSSSPATSGSRHGARATVATIIRSSAPGAVDASSTAWWMSASRSTRAYSMMRVSTSASLRRSASSRATLREETSTCLAAGSTSASVPPSRTTSRMLAAEVRSAVSGFFSS